MKSLDTPTKTKTTSSKLIKTVIKNNLHVKNRLKTWEKNCLESYYWNFQQEKPLTLANNPIFLIEKKYTPTKSMELFRCQFLHGLKKVLPHRTRRTLEAHVCSKLICTPVYKRWTPNDDDMLIKGLKKGMRIPSLIQKLDRTRNAIYHRINYLKLFKTRSDQKQKFTKKEDAALQRAVQVWPVEYPTNWSKISISVRGRNRKQCFNRYKYILKRYEDSDLMPDPDREWTIEDDQLLIGKVQSLLNIDKFVNSLNFDNLSQDVWWNRKAEYLRHRWACLEWVTYRRFGSDTLPNVLFCIQWWYEIIYPIDKKIPSTYIFNHSIVPNPTIYQRDGRRQIITHFDAFFDNLDHVTKFIELILSHRIRTERRIPYKEWWTQHWGIYDQYTILEDVWSKLKETFYHLPFRDTNLIGNCRKIRYQLEVYPSKWPPPEGHETLFIFP